jgi:hypothetical protein
MPRRRKEPKKEGAGQTRDKSVCVNLSNIAEYVRYIYFYKANMASLVVTGLDLWNITDLDKYVEEFNSYVKDWARRRKKLEELLLSPEDFAKCDVALSSDEIVEVKEYLKSSTYLHKLKTAETFKTTSGFSKLAKVADAMFRVTVGEDSLLAFIDVDGRELETRQNIRNMNMHFLRLASGGLGYTELYMLATALAVKYSPGKLVRLVLIKDKYFTSTPLGASAEAGDKAFYRLFERFADFYIGLVEAKSQYTMVVASALLAYIQTRDLSHLYGILRNTTQTEKLTPKERQVLNGLLEQVP